MASINELLDQIDMECYLDREGLDYKITIGSNGRQLNVRECPVCGGGNHKVYLNAETGLGNCFHGDCEAKFNKFTFIRAHLGTDDTRVVRLHLQEVAREMGWRPKRAAIKEVVLDTDWELPDSFELPIEGLNLTYLENRGITQEITRYFHLRYCDVGWYHYVDDEGQPRRQFFGGRVIIPVFDLDGKLVTFQGRDISGESERKYLFPNKLPGTGRFLYNGHNAVGASRVVVGEGAFDVMAIKIAVDEEMALRDYVPVGTFGKHLSYGHTEGDDQLGRFVKLRDRGLREVVFMWDGEARALADAMKAGDMLRRLGIKVRIAQLPKGKDPNEVPASVVAGAIIGAEVLTPRLMVQWSLRNPYA